MNDYYPVDPGALDAAILAAEQVLAAADPSASRMTLAAEITLAVLPELLCHLELQQQDAMFELAQARSATAHARGQLDAALRAARDQSNRIRMVFEELSPELVAQLIVGAFEGVGHRTTRRDEVLVHAAVAQTTKRIAQAIGLALSADARRIVDP